jgi:hypothetical protein
MTEKLVWKIEPEWNRKQKSHEKLKNSIAKRA